ncbi:MAG: OmpA family protein [Gammaproteobacteria bacterium]|nr:OmpA family protein [Gammaproteobacteria bacterium]
MSKITGMAMALWLLLGTVALAQAADDNNLRGELFRGADAALEAAQQVRADILAPDNFARASKLYAAAEEKLERKKSIDKINDDLAESIEYFKAAVKASRLAEVTFADVLRVRNAAIKSETSQFAPDLWQSAEKRFADAAGKLEDGNVNSARSRAETAQEEYLAAELVAIKNRYLGEVRQLLEQADRDKVDKYAPQTLAAAAATLQRAVDILDADRYNSDDARVLAQQARYEVRHAMQLADTLQPLARKKVSLEEFALQAEAPLQQIARALDMEVQFDSGIEAPTQRLVNRAKQLREESLELGVRREEVADLQGEVKTLQQRLGIQSDRINAQDEMRRKLLQVDSAFSLDEAVVYQQGSNILIRMVGLNFDTGRAAILPEYFSLLRKVIDSLRLFPGASLIVEGHTDSLGSELNNINLSQKRADAVVEYLKANMPELSGSSIMSMGYGENRPVSNNETAEGRKTNRRIDLLIKPKS